MFLNELRGAWAGGTVAWTGPRGTPGRPGASVAISSLDRTTITTAGHTAQALISLERSEE